MKMENVSQSVQVIAVVVGVVISVVSFNSTRVKDTEARVVEAETRRIEAMAPFYLLRQEKYVEVAKVSAILAEPNLYSEEEKKEAERRFRALYVSELSMVESPAVEVAMKDFAESTLPGFEGFSKPQSAAYTLSHTLRDSFTYKK